MAATASSPAQVLFWQEWETNSKAATLSPDNSTEASPLTGGEHGSQGCLLG